MAPQNVCGWSEREGGGVPSGPGPDPDLLEFCKALSRLLGEVAEVHYPNFMYANGSARAGGPAADGC